MSTKGIKRKALSVGEKMNILNEVEKNSHLTRIQIAKKLDLPVTTLNGIVAKQEIIRSAYQNNSSKAKKFKKGKYEDIEEKLIVWFKQARSANIPVSGTILREKAEEISKKLDIEFVASNGWIDRMKKRAGLVYKSINGECKSVDIQEATEWKVNVLPNLLSGYREKDIFNMDECGLFYNLLPDKTFSFKGEKCYGGKCSKERVTVLLGSNMDGSEKLPLLIVGKSKKPRCFKNVKSLPCKYENNKASWMTVTIFESYMKRLDSKMRKEKRKIVIFVDNCTAHSSNMKLQNIKIQFLPPNSTSVLQPMDQGVIKAFKQYFRKRLVKWMLLKIENGEEVKKLDLLESMHFITSAWESVHSNVIANYFKKAGFSNGDLTEIYEPEIEEWKTLQNEMNFSTSFSDYVNVDSDVTPNEILSIDDICELEPDENEDELGDIEDDTPTPSYIDAVKGLETFRRYIETQENVPEEIFKNLGQLDCFHLQIVEKNRKQKTILDFFKNANVNA